MIQTNHYIITPYDNLLSIEAFGAFDLRIVKEGVVAWLDTVSHHYQDKPYGLLYDLSNWELHTPEVADFWDELFNQDIHFPTHIAFVVRESEIKQWAIDRLFNESIPFEASFFANNQAASIWLEKHGYHKS